MRWLISILVYVLFLHVGSAQTGSLHIKVISGEVLPEGVYVKLDSALAGNTDKSGMLQINDVTPGKHVISISTVGYQTVLDTIVVASGQLLKKKYFLTSKDAFINEVVVSATLTEMSKSE